MASPRPTSSSFMNPGKRRARGGGSALWAECFFIIAFHGLPYQRAVAKVWYAAQASSSGGTTVRRGAKAWVTASLICAADAAGNSEYSSAIAPVTNGAAALVPPNVRGLPSALRLVIPSPGG